MTQASDSTFIDKAGTRPPRNDLLSTFLLFLIYLLCSDYSLEADSIPCFILFLQFREQRQAMIPRIHV
jgi:hypothetical protein